ncbi:MaoC family dehydratase [Nocardia sp. NPDC050378]|uniref:MaoC family dehydratase n=1 Tax=Nocardia sp. NPDC050378 TaxID=3155400 RepID=UPI0033C9AABD
MRVFQGVADLEGAVGTHLGYSGWHTITQAQINAFADATGDHQWIHIDTEKAADGPFGTTIAHGYLTLSLLPLLVPQVYRVEGVRMAVNYGANKLRFPAPVPVDSKVRAGIELVSVAAGAAGHLVTSRVTVEREGGDKPVCVVESLTLVVA